MKRFLFNLVTIFSLILLLATVGMWVHSYDISDRWDWRRVLWSVRPVGMQTQEVELESSMGRVRLTNGTLMGFAYSGPFNFDNPTGFYSDPATPMRDLPGGFHWAGIEFWSSNRAGFMQPVRAAEVVTLPYWLPALLFLILPAIWLVRGRRRPSRTLGQYCRNCGYDLRGSPDRCPECGAVPRSTSQVGG